MTKEELCRYCSVSMEDLDNGCAYIDLSNSSVDSLPDNLNVSVLFLRNCTSLERLPENLNAFSLDISGCTSLTSLPASLRVGILTLDETNISEIPEFCMDMCQSISAVDCKNLKRIPKIHKIGRLDLSGSVIEALPETLEVCDYLGLVGCKNLTSLPASLKQVNRLNVSQCENLRSLPEDLLVIEDLHIEHSGIVRLPENLMVGNGFYASHTDLKTIPSQVRIGGLVDLSYCKKLFSLPEGWIVNGYLGLAHSWIHELPEHLTVKGNLDLMFTGISSLPSTLRIGGELHTHASGITEIPYLNKDVPLDLERQIWKGSGYLSVDGQLVQVLSEHDGYWETQGFLEADIDDDDMLEDAHGYIVTDGNGTYAHGHTLEEAWDDLNFKLASRDLSEYAKLSLDSVLSYDEAIVCYRVITGACRAGTEHFLKRNLKEKKTSYTIQEIIELTEGQYGNMEFKSFFMKVKPSLVW